MDMQSVETIVVPEVVEMPINNTSSSSMGFFDTIKERFSGQEPWAVELVMFGLGGFVVGFLLKNFGRIACLLLAAVIVAAVALHYTHIYEMPLETLQSYVGVSDMSSLQSLINAKIDFCKEHPVASVSGLVGLLVGWKVG